MRISPNIAMRTWLFKNVNTIKDIIQVLLLDPIKYNLVMMDNGVIIPNGEITNCLLDGKKLHGNELLKFLKKISPDKFIASLSIANDNKYVRYTFIKIPYTAYICNLNTI